MTTCKSLTKHEMLQVFTVSPESIVGEPTMKELIRVLRHLIDCSQSHKLESKNDLNLLHMCCPEELYRAFSTNSAAQQYLQQVADPGKGPQYTPKQDVLVWANKKLLWERLKQIFKEEKTIDAALYDRFL